MTATGWLVRDEPRAERLWAAGCYIAAYNVPAAEILLRYWPAESVRLYPDQLPEWLRQNWPGIPFRRERRAVRTPNKLATFLVSYERWLRGWENREWLSGGLLSPEEAYETGWKDVQRVYGLGRYVALKILEFMRRYCEAPIELPDLRARGGWSPRAGLALLFPNEAATLQGNDSAANVARANALAERGRDVLRSSYNVALDRYEMQVLLCDYKQSAIGRRQYPGRSQDSEMEHAAKAAVHWGDQNHLWAARQACFPEWALGEFNGWEGVREELGHVLADFGYTWSDALYDWKESRDDLAAPVTRLHQVAV